MQKLLAIELAPQQTFTPGINLGDALRLRSDSAANVGAKFSTLSSFLNLFVPLLFLVAGIILFFLLIGGGFSIIASGGNAKNVEGGKNAITGAIIGFFVMFAAFWIIQIIQIVTGVPILSSGL